MHACAHAAAALQAGIADWLAGGQSAEAQSSRQLRHSSTRLVGHLRTLSRGLPAEPSHEDWLEVRRGATVLYMLPVGLSSADTTLMARLAPAAASRCSAATGVPWP